MTRYDPCPQAETCPGCGEVEGVEQTSTSPRVTAWKCNPCQLSWAISLVNHGQRPTYFEQLAATVEKVDRLRRLLGQVVALADDADGLSDEQLRTRLLALAVLPLCGVVFMPRKLVGDHLALSGEPSDPRQICPQCNRAVRSAQRETAAKPPQPTPEG